MDRPVTVSEPQTLELPTGTMRLWRLTPRVVHTHVVGRFSVEHLSLLIPAMDAAVAASREGLIGLHDWTEVESYDVSVSAQLTTWTVRNARGIERVLIAASSPLVMMALRTGNLAFGGRAELVDSAEAIRDAAREYGGVVW